MFIQFHGKELQEFPSLKLMKTNKYNTQKNIKQHREKHKEARHSVYHREGATQKRKKKYSGGQIFEGDERKRSSCKRKLFQSQRLLCSKEHPAHNKHLEGKKSNRSMGLHTNSNKSKQEIPRTKLYFKK